MADNDLRFDVQTSCSAKESLHLGGEPPGTELRTIARQVGLFWLEPQKLSPDQGSSAPGSPFRPPRSLIYIVRSTLKSLIGRQMKRSQYPLADRAGVSLLETVLAVSILAAALAALGHQTFTGLRASVRVELETRAALLCQSCMERLVTAQDMTLPISGEPIPDSPDWRWSAELKPVPDIDELQWLIVSVVQPGPQAELSRYSLVRLMPMANAGKGDSR